MKSSLPRVFRQSRDIYQYKQLQRLNARNKKQACLSVFKASQSWRQPDIIRSDSNKLVGWRHCQKNWTRNARHGCAS